MLQFSPIAMEHRAAMLPFLAQDNVPATERNFASLFMWGGHYHTQICLTDTWCFLRAKGEADEAFGYYPPLGSGDVKEALRLIAQTEGDEVVHLFSLTQAQAAQYSALFGDACTITPTRDSFDYLYEGDALRTLPGKANSAKRNHINKFMKLYGDAWEYRALDFARDGDAVLEFHRQWCLAKEESGQASDDYRHERCAISRALKNHAALGLLGGILFVNDAIAAYTIACATNASTLDILIEKGNIEVHGAYAVINKEFANDGGAPFAWFNREEDLGLEGLRKAKLSYNPAYLLEKYSAEVRL